MIIYLQVAQISQALIFITRSHSWFFLERPSVALFLAFCLAQLISSIIAAYGDWGFTAVQGISGGWIGIIWIWNVRLSHRSSLVVRGLTRRPDRLVLPARPGQVWHARPHQALPCLPSQQEAGCDPDRRGDWRPAHQDQVARRLDPRVHVCYTLWP